jgi:hypothetical protein
MSGWTYMEVANMRRSEFVREADEWRLHRQALEALREQTGDSPRPQRRHLALFFRRGVAHGAGH